MAAPHKRPYPNETAPDHSQAKMGRNKQYQSMYYSGMQWGQPTNYGASSGPPDAAKANVDFTDDYSAFYGNPQTNNYGGGYGGWGQYRGQGQGQGWGRGYSNRGAATGPQNTNQGQGQGNVQGNGNYQGQSKVQGRGGRGTGSRGRGQPGRGAQATRSRGRGRGMPPNQFGSWRGRGRGKPASVPPVHSLAKAKPNFPDITQMSIAEKLHRFCLFLRNEDCTRVNAIQTIVNAITSSKLGLKIDFEATEITWLSNQKLYTGALKIEDVFLARSAALSKKELKQSVFEKALNLMTTSTVADIFNLVDPGPEAMKEQMMGQKKEKEKEGETLKKGEVPPSDLEGALKTLIIGIQTMKTVPDNAISVIEQALIQTHTVVSHEYTFETIKTPEETYIGKYTFAGVVLGRGQGTNKKLCKRQAYQQMLDRLTSLTIDELVMSVPELPAPEISKKQLTKAAMLELPFEERFKEMMNVLSGMNFTANLVNPIDVTAVQNGLHPMLIYKPAVSKEKEHSIVCQLYIEKVFLASGESVKKKESMVNAYSAAWDILTTSNADTILKEHHRITDEEIRCPSIMDVIMKGSGKAIESNLAGLKKFGHNTMELKKTLEDLVIIEHFDWASDRSRNAFCILQFSCSQNGIYMQWETQPITAPDLFKCIMTIDKKVMGESYGYSKPHARNLAASEALHKLYETNTVIKIRPRKEEEDWIPYEEITKEAESLKGESTDTEAEPETDDFGNALPDPFVSKVIEKRLAQYVESSREEVSELIFGPGFTDPECRHLRKQAKLLNLKYDSRQKQGKIFFLIYEKLDWDVLGAILKKKKEHQYGKYELVPASELPKYSDIEKSILKEKPPPRVKVPKQEPKEPKEPKDLKDKTFVVVKVETEEEMDATTTD